MAARKKKAKKSKGKKKAKKLAALKKKGFRKTEKGNAAALRVNVHRETGIQTAKRIRQTSERALIEPHEGIDKRGRFWE